MPEATYDDDGLRRIAHEIINGPHVYEASAGGPEGPWFYKSLRVHRVMNTIRVYDVDGQLFNVLEVEDVVQNPVEPVTWLRHTLDEYHNESLDAL